jgi:hypothetical protein
MQDLASGFAEALGRGLFAEVTPPPGTGGAFGVTLPEAGSGKSASLPAYNFEGTYA